jgi:hypothetical protein
MGQLKEMTFSPGGFTGGSLVSTLISIVPFPIAEFKPGLIPGNFNIAASVDGKPQFKVLGESYHYVYIDAERGQLRVLDPSYDVAQAVVNDYNSSQLEADPMEHPGLFWLLGEWDEEKLMANPEAREKLETVRGIQDKWFHKICILADDDWERSRQHSAISDVQRFAARVIDPENKRNRPWVFVLEKERGEVDPTQTLMNNALCPACSSEIVSTAVVCRYCKYILDQERYAQMRFAGEVSPVVQTGAGMGAVNLRSVMEKASQ